MSESRDVPRKRVLKAGTIDFDGSGGRVTCAVRNITESGAALEMEGFVALPRDLTLIIEPHNLPLRCQVVWRKEKRVGVKFK